jgi:hypothetical protein
MAARFAWVLNLDADLELAVPAYTPKATVRDAMRMLVPVVAANLLGPDDVLIDETPEPGIARGLVGRAFCPTPRAIAILERAGATPEHHPSVDVLRRVNSRAFSASLGQTLPDAELVTDEATAFAKIARSGAWRVKRLFGMSGKNQRVVGVAAQEIDRGFVRAGIAEGGVQIEPNVAVEEEYAVHATLGEDGTLKSRASRFSGAMRAERGSRASRSSVRRASPSGSRKRRGSLAEPSRRRATSGRSASTLSRTKAADSTRAARSTRATRWGSPEHRRGDDDRDRREERHDAGRDHRPRLREDCPEATGEGDGDDEPEDEAILVALPGEQAGGDEQHAADGARDEGRLALRFDEAHDAAGDRDHAEEDEVEAGRTDHRREE